MSQSEQFTSQFPLIRKYVELLENETAQSKLTLANVDKAFELSRYVEAAVLEARKEAKEVAFDAHLRSAWSRMDRSVVYCLNDLEFACDKMLETYLKTPKIPIEIVDKLLDLYFRHCGRERLGKFMDNLLTNCMLNNFTLELLGDLRVEESEIKGKAIFADWEFKIKCNRHNDVTRLIDQSLERGKLRDLIKLVGEERGGELERRVYEDLIYRAHVNDIPLFIAVSNLDKQSFSSLLKNPELSSKVVETIFYLCKNMTRNEDGEWRFREIEYNHIVKTVQSLIRGSREKEIAIKKKIREQKALNESRIWTTLEIDCFRNTF